MNTNQSSRSFIYVGCTALIVMLGACAASRVEPVDIFPEDNCGLCRMAISDERFASEIIDEHGEVYKFDDIGCMMKFTQKHTDKPINAIFLKDYETKEWVAYERAIIVDTGIETPMGSGKIASADSGRARALQDRHPAIASENGCTATCCQ